MHEEIARLGVNDRHRRSGPYRHREASPASHVVEQYGGEPDEGCRDEKHRDESPIARDELRDSCRLAEYETADGEAERSIAPQDTIAQRVEAVFTHVGNRTHSPK